MNKFTGYISNIETSDDLSIVEIKISEEISFQTIIVETPLTADYLRIDKKINVLFKETEVIIGKNINTEISLRNRVEGIVTHIEKGNLIGKITLETSIGNIIAIISKKSIENLAISEKSVAIAFVKLNELILSE